MDFAGAGWSLYMVMNFGVKTSVCGELVETLEIAFGRRLSRPRRQVIALDGGGEPWRRTEKAARFGRQKTRKPRGFEIGGGSIRCLDQRDELRRQQRRQPETHMDRGQQACFDRLVGVPDHRLER